MYLTAIKWANKLLHVPAFCLEKYIFMMTWKVKFELRMLIFLLSLAGILGDCGESGPQARPPTPTLHSQPVACPFSFTPQLCLILQGACCGQPACISKFQSHLLYVPPPPQFILPCGRWTWGRGLQARETGLGPFGQGVPGSCMPMVCSQEVECGGHIHVALPTAFLPCGEGWGQIRVRGEPSYSAGPEWGLSCQI